MFCQKNVHSVKNTLPCHFFLVFYEKSPAVKPIFGKKNVGFVKIALYVGSKKLIGCSFCSAFSRKNHFSHAHILSKIVYSLKTHYSHTHISQKNVHSLKNTMLSCVFYFSNFSWKTPAIVHMIGQKMSILSKLHSILGQKSQYDALFSYFSQKKLLLLCPYFVKKRSFSKKK